MNSDDIALLFDKLVILPSDRNDEIDVKNTDSKLGESTPTAEPTSTPTPVESPAKTVVSEPVKPIVSHPFVIVTNTSLKEILSQDSSNFKKIINSLKIGNAAKYLQPINSLDLQAADYDCIWCIGLGPEEEATVKSLKHSNVLFSPNMETLATKEEKLAMFNPLKDFVSSNMGLLSQL